MDVIPSLDLLGGNVVRLLRGDFANVTTYGDSVTVLDSLDVPRGSHHCLNRGWIHETPRAKHCLPRNLQG